MYQCVCKHVFYIYDCRSVGAAGTPGKQLRPLKKGTDEQTDRQMDKTEQGDKKGGGGHLDDGLTLAVPLARATNIIAPCETPGPWV